MPKDKNKSKKQKSLKPLIALNIALAAILCGILFYLFKGYDSAAMPVKSIPAFGMQSAMHDGSFDNGTLNEPVFILNVFASWCKPCEAEHPVLSELANTHNIPLFGIALSDNEDDLNRFLERLGNPYRDIGLDHAALMLGGLGIGGVPTTLVADKDQNIHWIIQGPITPDISEKQILPLIEKLKAES